MLVNVLANKAAINKGLQGITIAPKKKPNKNPFNNGCLLVGVFGFGMNLETSKLNIKNKLIIPKIPKAIGEIIPITFVNETSNIVVKINPKINIKTITPAVITNPSNVSVFFPES